MKVAIWERIADKIKIDIAYSVINISDKFAMLCQM